MAGNDTFLHSMAFEHELDRLEEEGNPMKVSLFLAREVHAMCKVCQEHTEDINVLKQLHPTKKESLITGAAGGGVATVVFGIVYYLGKWFHIWD